jgi:hypothetical protein
VPCEEGFGEVSDALGEGGADGQFDGISWGKKRGGCKIDGVFEGRHLRGGVQDGGLEVFVAFWWRHGHHAVGK